MTTVEPLLSFRGLSKTFGNTKALDGIDFDVLPGEVHALVGQNGSGKSTLIKLLSGLHAADEGSVGFYDGEPLDLTVTSARRSANIHVVHQDPGLIHQMSTVENLILVHGGNAGSRARIDWKAEAESARKILSRFDIEVDVRRPLSEASPVERAIVAIAIAASGFGEGTAPLLVLDEPTAILPHHEVERLLDLVKQLKAQGVSVLYVSHRLSEIFEICDRVTVLRDARLVGTRHVRETSQHGLAELMVGGKLAEQISAGEGPAATSRVALEIQSLSTQALAGVDLEIRRGEIVGIAGFPGSGAEDILAVLSASEVGPVSGRVRFGGPDGTWLQAGRLGTARPPLVPADRLRHGVVPQLSVRENLTLSVLGRLGRVRISARRESALLSAWTAKLSIKAPSGDDLITTLSGGNQQKVVLAQCLASDPNVLLLSEPTAGVDIGTRQAIYQLLHGLAAEGLAVLVSSTDPGDLLSLCHRIVVINEGSVVAELDQDAMSESNLLVFMEIKPMKEPVLT